MGEIPKKEVKPQQNETTATPNISALFSSPKSFPLFLCCSAIVVMGGFIFYAATRPAPIQLSDVTRSPLGFDVASLDEEEDDELLAALPTTNSMTTSPTLSTPTSYSTSPSYSTGSPSTSPAANPTPPLVPSTTQPPTKSPARQPRRAPHTQHQTVEPFEDPQLYDEDLRGHLVANDTTEFHNRIEMLEQEIHQLRSVLAQRERMISQLSKELTESRATPPQAPTQAAPIALEPVTRQISRTHIVQKGETLSEIAQFYYGNRSAWGKIYRANAEKLPDKNRLPVGALLIIPE